MSGFSRWLIKKVDEAVVWYGDKAEGKGRDFMDELDRVVRLVKAYPLASIEVEPEIRRCLFARFPYSLVYGINDQMIVVIAIAHSHREPRYWVDRLTSQLPI